MGEGWKRAVAAAKATRQKPKQAKLDYKKMLEDINRLVQTDFCSAMELNLLPNTKTGRMTEFTQDEAIAMVAVISQVYMIAHCTTCEACQHKYLIKKPDEKAKN